VEVQEKEENEKEGGEEGGIIMIIGIIIPPIDAPERDNRHHQRQIQTSAQLLPNRPM
jgi:hypothetical protein